MSTPCVVASMARRTDALAKGNMPMTDLTPECFEQRLEAHCSPEEARSHGRKLRTPDDVVVSHRRTHRQRSAAADTAAWTKPA